VTVDGVYTKYKTQGRKMAKTEWKTWIEDVVALGAKLDENDVTYIAIKHNLKVGTAKVYINTVRMAERGQDLKGNYNQKFLDALRGAGFNFQVRVKKPEPKPQPTMGLMDYSVTGDVQSLHDEIETLKRERDLYKRRYEGMIRSIELIHRANPKLD